MLEQSRCHHATHEPTILHLTDSSLEVVHGEIAHLVADVVPVHDCGVVRANWSIQEDVLDCPAQPDRASSRRDIGDGGVYT